MRLPCESVPVFGFCCAGCPVAGCAGVEEVRCCIVAAGLPADGVAEVGEPAEAAVDRPAPPETVTGAPPLDAPPKETTRVDRMGVFPPWVRLEPSCNGMISFRVPLSRTIEVGVISVMIYP